MAISQKKILFSISATLCLITLVSVCVLITEYLNNREEIIAPFQAQAMAQSTELANWIEATLNQSVPLAAELSEALRDASLRKSAKESESVLIDHLKRALNTTPELLGVGIAYKPFSYDPDVRLFAPYFLRRDGELKRIQIENQVDYTVDEYDWYHNPLNNGSGWNEPRFSQAADQMVVEYAAPFVQKDAATGQYRIMGVVFLHYSLNDILEKIKTLNMGKTGFAILLSQQGTILWHPNKAYIDTEKSALSVAKETNNILLEQIGQMAMARQNGRIEEIKGLSDQTMWANIQLIPTTKWTLVMLYSEQDITRGNRSLRHQLIWIAVIFIAFVLSLITMDLSRRKERKVLTLWFCALEASLLFSLGIVFVWFLATDDIAWKNTERMVIVDQPSLETFKRNNIRTALRTRQPLPIYIPTGVFVQSIEFTSANNVILTGYIWQHYSHHVPDKLSRGFVLPEAESSTIVESYRRPDKTGEVIGWYFHATLRQEFNYTHYPFDQQTVWMRLWHQDFDKNVILLPALDSYDQIHPERLPGIEQDFVLPGWEVASSFFNYRFNSYNTDFGIPRYVGQNKFPELYFQIAVKRSFLNPFISNLTPIIVVLLMLFAVLITSSKESKKIELLGFNASTILAASSALFFVVLISHIDLRSSLAANEIFYMEYFYVVAYVALLSISINSILFSWGINISFIQYRDNLLPKLFYWPLITLTMFVVTLVKFY